MINLLKTEILENGDVNTPEECEAWCAWTQREMRKHICKERFGAGTLYGRQRVVEQNGYHYVIDAEEESGPFLVTLSQFLEAADSGETLGRMTFWQIDVDDE